MLVRVPLLASVLVVACAKPAEPKAAAVPTSLLEVETVNVDARNGVCSFNSARPWVVSVHNALDDGQFAADLAREVEQADLSGQVVLDWFGSDALERVEVVLGRDLPVDLAGAIVRVTRQHRADGLVVSVSEEQSTSCNRSRAYVGSLLPTENGLTSESELDVLVTRQLDDAAFWSRLPSSGR